MSRTCTACTHPDRSAIDRALLAGEPLRKVAKRVTLSTTSLFRHRTHIETAVVNAVAATEAELGSDLAHKLVELAKRAGRLAEAAEKGGDLRTALGGVRELARILEIEARVAGQIHETKVKIELSGRKLDGLNNDDIASVINERLDTAILNGFVNRLLERSPWWNAEPGPPKPPDWVLIWANSYMAWRVRTAGRTGDPSD